MSLPVVHGFKALQGEGSRMGVPSYFLRLGGCNMICPGFNCSIESPKDGTVLIGCDSQEATRTKHFKDQWNYYDDFSSVVKLIQDGMKGLSDENDNAEPYDLVITGGESMLHATDPVLISTLEYFISRGHKIFFETNGTVALDFEKYPVYKKVSFSMSVKMSSSGEEKSKRWRPEVVNEYLKNTDGSYFKFVLSKDSLQKETGEVLEFLNQVPTFGTVYCMPLGEVTETINVNALTVYEFALNNGFRYSDRLHIRMFEDEALR